MCAHTHRQVNNSKYYSLIEQIEACWKNTLFYYLVFELGEFRRKIKAFS